MAHGNASGVLLVDRELSGLFGSAVTAARPLRAEQVQPASLDLRLAGDARRLRASFLPGRVPLERRLAELELERRTLDDAGIVLTRGSLHLIRLEEELALPPDLRATFNPRSSTGRCDVFARVVVPGHARFDETPPGYHGPLWLEVAPLSFDVRVARGDALCQMRLERGRAVLTPAELAVQHAALPLVHLDGRPVSGSAVRWHPEGGIELALGLAGRDPAGWRARHGVRAELVLGREKSGAAAEFFEAVHAPDGRTLLAPGDFTLFASRERLQIPPHLAADVVPVDVGIGELRNNYAGFFDPGFGRGVRPDGRPGTPAVLEVRAHDVPFQVEDGQVLFRLRFFRLSGLPERCYAEGRSGASYGDQDLALARVFR